MTKNVIIKWDEYQMCVLFVFYKNFVLVLYTQIKCLEAKWTITYTRWLTESHANILVTSYLPWLITAIRCCKRVMCLMWVKRSIAPSCTGARNRILLPSLENTGCGCTSNHDSSAARSACVYKNYKNTNKTKQCLCIAGDSFLIMKYSKKIGFIIKQIEPLIEKW